MEICLLAAGKVVHLGTIALTLAWTHSVQKTRWEEDWRLSPAGLVVTESRIESSGAGMEPEPGAIFDGRWWRSKPASGPVANVVLRRSGATADWDVCIAGRCRPMGDIVPADSDPVSMTPCP